MIDHQSACFGIELACLEDHSTWIHIVQGQSRGLQSVESSTVLELLLGQPCRLHSNNQDSPYFVTGFAWSLHCDFSFVSCSGLWHVAGPGPQSSDFLENFDGAGLFSEVMESRCRYNFCDGVAVVICSSSVSPESNSQHQSSIQSYCPLN